MILLLHSNFLTFGKPEGQCLLGFLRVSAQSVTIIGVNLFVLITGYFGTTFKWSKVVALVYQVLFAVVPVTVALYCVGYFKPAGAMDWIRGCMFWKYWFINAYIGLLVFTPILNAAVENLGKVQLRNVIVSAFALMSLFGGGMAIYLHGLDSIGGYSVWWFMELYLIGRYIRIYPITISPSQLIGVYLTGLAGTIALMWFFAVDQYDSVFITLQSVALFLLFTKLDFRSVALNWVAASVTMAYLLNLHPVGVGLFTESVKSLYAGFDASASFVMATIGFCAVFFIVSILYDKLRIASYKGLQRLITKQIDI